MTKIKVFMVLFSISICSAQPKSVSFPDGFKWCASTAAHQIEGSNVHNDWWAWEQGHSNIKNGEKSGLACDSWNRFKQDILALKYLNATDYRMSIEWARLEPQQGSWDETAIIHYKKQIDDLKANGIRPVLTLHHFTFPKWVADRGGWEWDGIVEAFSKFADVAYTRIAPGVADWITVNEPMVNIFAGYVEGIFPPGQKREFNGVLPLVRGVLKSHAAAYQLLHKRADEIKAPVRVGMAHHLRKFQAAQWWNPLDHLAAYLVDRTWNWALPDALETGTMRFILYGLLSSNEEIPNLKSTQDYLGINYYTTDQIHLSLTKGLERRGSDKFQKSDLNWDIDAEGFFDILMKATQRYPNKSIFITENGIADSSDVKRRAFLIDYLGKLSQAIEEGAPVEGYCHWSLMDNFEWAEGFTPRFGLFETNYSSYERIPRGSANLFRDIAANNGFTR